MRPALSLACIGQPVVLCPIDYWHHIEEVSPGELHFPPTPQPHGLAFVVDFLFVEDPGVIGISGPVVSGPAGMLDLVANCFARFDRSYLDLEPLAHCNFRISSQRASRHRRFSHQVVEGTSAPYPQFVGVGLAIATDNSNIVR